MKFITTYKSKNFNTRSKKSIIKFIIIHYTAIKDFNESLEHLCDLKKKVSSHFVISKHGDIYKLVNENKRAWHAGKSYWKGIKDLNSYSIGIELENTGCELDFEEYGNKQIKSLIGLIKKIKLNKKYKISNFNILGHSDIAPMRKSDPGKKFPWKKLDNLKLSYLPKINKLKQKNEYKKFDIIDYKKKLKKIGYNIRIDRKKDIDYRQVTRAFQMHYQQHFVRGYPNRETYMLVDQFSKDIVD
ncbi:MAG: N-acetylmuramoyl-L-alanine amidase AmiD [Alphaproteobacteria bacterium MarineAlpha5_Bin12]|nr:N-acetylmuramoyl-L-alanine amidase [Pelagibacteraceae bacterium]PPR42034.1 MAG: N-acetylmuramoyl-L-alanine amidase AmiD [Alphaproteobacteria bacterium MarineAlpha5_Bin12]|tara:strand:+ start:3875 stop:4603 length:729 start_codon:yes stop_codon:yes gene_type:complete